MALSSKSGPRTARKAPGSNAAWAVKTACIVMLCMAIGSGLGVTNHIAVQAMRAADAAQEALAGDAKSQKTTTAPSDRPNMARKAVKGW